MLTAYRCSLHATRSHLRIAKESSLLNVNSIKYLDRCLVQHLNTVKSLLSSFTNNRILHKYKNNIVPLCKSNMSRRMSSSNSTTGRSSEFEGQDTKNSDAKVCDNKNASDSLKATMKQIPRHIAKTQIHQKEQPAEISLYVLGTGAQGTPQSLLIVMNAFRYLFNCGEGTQRILSEQRLKISRLERIFVTHRSWKNIGGALGMVLTLDRNSVPVITVHGPPKTTDLIKKSRSFANQLDVGVDTHHITDGTFSDCAMQIDAVPITTQKYAGMDCTEDPPLSSEEAKHLHSSIAYICKPHERPRSLLLQKCLDLGVPKGPMLAQLKKGKEVTLDSGKIVKPEDVLSPSIPTNTFIILECPDSSYVESLVTNDVWKQYEQDDVPVQDKTPVQDATSVQDADLQSNPQDASPGSTSEYLEVIVHFTPAHIARDPRYRQWMNRFGSRTQHLLLNDSCCSPTFECVYKLQTQLNLLHNNIFPTLPREIQICEPELESPNITYGSTGLAYTYRGRRKDGDPYNRSNVINLDFDAYLSEAKEQLTIGDIELRKYEANAETRYPEVVFLGTGSATPEKTRNVSAILVNLSSSETLLMDCGEDTAGQLYRFYGEPKVYEILRKLKAVFISHLHADHHMGLIGLLQARQLAYMKNPPPTDGDCPPGHNVPPPLMMLAPREIKSWHKDLDSIFNNTITKSFKYVSTSVLCKKSHNFTIAEVQTVCQHLNLRELETVYMRHKQIPFGLVITHNDGWKICYSGDTMPCDRFVEAGKGSDLLIHEATMEDTLADDAKKKNHSTTSEAIEVGVKMGAKFTLLTHFSQRYDRMPLINESFTNTVGIAYDNMRITLDELQDLPGLYPSMKALFAKSVSRNELKSLKRKMKSQYEKEQNEKKKLLNETELNKT